MDTPPIFRGNFYPTHMTARCPEFHACEICHGCKHFDPYSVVCMYCEQRKPKELICRHSDEQEYRLVMLNRMFHKPIFHPDDPGKEVSIPVAQDPRWEEIANGDDSLGLGKIQWTK